MSASRDDNSMAMHPNGVDIVDFFYRFSGRKPPSAWQQQNGYGYRSVNYTRWHSSFVIHLCGYLSTIRSLLPPANSHSSPKRITTMNVNTIKENYFFLSRRTRRAAAACIIREMGGNHRRGLNRLLFILSSGFNFIVRDVECWCWWWHMTRQDDRLPLIVRQRHSANCEIYTFPKGRESKREKTAKEYNRIQRHVGDGSGNDDSYQMQIKADGDVVQTKVHRKNQQHGRHQHGMRHGTMRIFGLFSSFSIAIMYSKVGNGGEKESAWKWEKNLIWRKSDRNRIGIFGAGTISGRFWIII